MSYHFNEINEILSVAKVGSSDFLHSINKNYTTINHGHSLLRLKYVLENKLDFTSEEISQPIKDDILKNVIVTKLPKTNFKGLKPSF